MDEEIERISFNYDGDALEASPKFTKFLKYISESEQPNQTLFQLGILTEQCCVVEKSLVLETSSDTVTNEDLRLETKRDDEPIKEKATKIERTVLGKARYTKISMSEYSDRTLHAVQWLLSELSKNFNDQRKEAIGKFCAKTGLNGIFEEPERETQSLSSEVEPLQSHLYDNEKMPHVGKL
ncbi:hypothetical protein ACOZ4I_20300 (plasmid) [Haloarcula salina]|uniref:hypothetical protein n=1 Tax=Haloarcula salina TaxID=1429914 RepID=UPI003C6EF9A6